jgi:hypothetical protein
VPGVVLVSCCFSTNQLVPPCLPHTEECCIWRPQSRWLPMRRAPRLPCPNSGRSRAGSTKWASRRHLFRLCSDGRSCFEHTYGRTTAPQPTACLPCDFFPTNCSTFHVPGHVPLHQPSVCTLWVSTLTRVLLPTFPPATILSTADGR